MIGIGMANKKNKVNVINSVKVIITPWQKGFTCGIIMDSQSKMTTEEYELCSTIARGMIKMATRSEEHTSELQSRLHLVCRLLLEKKNLTTRPYNMTRT